MQRFFGYWNEYIDLLGSDDFLNCVKIGYRIGVGRRDPETALHAP
jgi:hypothetical protein